VELIRFRILNDPALSVSVSFAPVALSVNTHHLTLTLARVLTGYDNLRGREGETGVNAILRLSRLKYYHD
ncbi:MAG: hypothetical protein LBQ58_05875, partial [Synergistaceae bacterium]|nr:hypothetical protein [Synergistaceae bacterium]